MIIDDFVISRLLPGEVYNYSIVTFESMIEQMKRYFKYEKEQMKRYFMYEKLAIRLS